MCGSVDDDKKRNISQKSGEYINELYNFYNRFDCLDFSQENEQLRNTLAAASAQEEEVQSPRTNEEEVRRAFRNATPTKAEGPGRNSKDMCR